MANHVKKSVILEQQIKELENKIENNQSPMTGLRTLDPLNSKMDDVKLFRRLRRNRGISE